MVIARQCYLTNILEKNFNELIDSFIKNKVGISSEFLGAALCGQLRKNLIDCHRQELMTNAGTGNKNSLIQDKLFRGDKIYWLDKDHNDVYENAFFEIMDRFVDHLNSTCYTGITNYEFHYTLYQTGSFYKRHTDQFKNDQSRKYSMIMYLNEGWLDADGGELYIHHTDALPQKISPDNGKSVFFKSDELEHEVLLTNKRRMSITGWLK